MQAVALPSGKDSSLYDFGLSLAQWVSAIEVLVHPHGTNAKGKDLTVDETTVLDGWAKAVWQKPF